MKKAIFPRLLFISILGVLVATTLWNGCGNSNHDHDHDSEHSHDGDHDHAHDGDSDHAPPHGGTPVLVSEDKFHLELVADATTGNLLAYVLDGHLEDYVSVNEGGFQLIAKTGDAQHTLEFKRVADSGNSEVSGPSSLFAAQADWVKTVKTFEGQIPSITLNGSTFTNITFPFPPGTKHVH